jgi:uncharacterized protein YggE
MRNIFIVLILILIPNLSLADEYARRITLTGVGEVFVAPDMAMITIGVSSFNKNASEAMRANSTDMAVVFEKLEGVGVEARDIQTAQISLNPRWERTTSNNVSRIVGYEAVNTVKARIRALDTVGTVLDVLSQSGANRISQVSFSIDKPRPYKDEARRRAVVDARTKAELYAKAAGLELGDVISISDNNVTAFQQPMARMEMSAMADNAVPVSQGEMGVREHVTIVYEIK